MVRHSGVDPSKTTIIDINPPDSESATWIAQGVSYVAARIDSGSVFCLLEKFASEADVVVDLTWRVDTMSLVMWCRQNRKVYVNTSIEQWGNQGKTDASASYFKLFLEHQRFLNLSKSPSKYPTALLEHGANPGLISHFVKKALLDLSRDKLDRQGFRGPYTDQIAQAIDSNQFAALAHQLGVKVIHCAELDSQSVSIPKCDDEFVNTWSSEGLYQEAVAPAIIALGTHEQEVPDGAILKTLGSIRLCSFDCCAKALRIRSSVVEQGIIGVPLPHGETVSISRYLTHRFGETSHYSPTVLYAYCPCPAAVASISELAAQNETRHSKSRILRDEITSGADILGALLMGPGLGAWWTGSELTIAEARELVPGQNATTVQVAIGVAAGVLWAVQNRDRGIVFSEDLPHGEILSLATPFLGTVRSEALGWNPAQPSSASRTGSDCENNFGWQLSDFLLPTNSPVGPYGRRDENRVP